MDWSALDRHTGKVAMSLSGGKDSTVVLWLLKQAGLLDRVTVYHLNTGDLFPEMLAHIETVRAWCPDFVTIQTDAKGWAAVHGDPSDLVPHSSHPVGQVMGEGRRLANRYDCCFANLMQPLYERIKADGKTLIIRGTRRSDMKKLATEGGQHIDGVEILHPIEDWSDQDVFDFAAREGVPLAAFYSHFRQGPECMTCPAWWHVDSGPYLKAHHPEKFAEYQERVSNVMAEITPCIRNLKAMLAAFEPEHS